MWIVTIRSVHPCTKDGRNACICEQCMEEASHQMLNQHREQWDVLLPTSSTWLMHLPAAFSCRCAKSCFILQFHTLLLKSLHGQPWLLKQIIDISKLGINHLRCPGSFHRQMQWLPLTKLFPTVKKSTPPMLTWDIIGKRIGDHFVFEI